jgi:signal transduction histidine kinase
VAVEPDADLARQRAEVDLLRRRVVNVVGHELKVPVSTIRGLALAIEASSPEMIRTEVGPALVRNTARLERLVDDLLLAAGVFTVLPVEPAAPREVGPVLERTWAALGGGGTLAVSGGADALVSTRGDALERMLSAVLDNAVKYGRAPVSVHVSAGETVTIEVRSNGAPRADDLALALEPFYRGEAAVMSTPGLGIGLAVAAALAAQDGGRIDVRADGNTVVATMELPAP